MAESEQREEKLSLNEWREVVESIAAFATSGGGTVRIGIGPRGERVGVQLGRTTLENLANQIKGNTDPRQYPSMEVDGSEDAAVIHVRIAESPVKPVWAFGRPLKRVGRTNQRLSPAETQRLMEATTGRTWDALPCRGLDVTGIDRRAVVAFLRRGEHAVRTATELVVENLKLMTPEGLCNAAALLFARKPQRFFPEAVVKCARFRGATSVAFLDQQALDGNLLAQLDGALAFIARNTRQALRITGAPEHEVVPEYPDAAVREALINAICHRDYTNTAMVQVRIYEDRLEVWNPGRLPAGLTVEALYQEHASCPRNPRLAAALYHARLIEQWGTGTLRIVGACRAAGLPRPEFIADMGMFIVRFRSPQLAPSQDALLNASDRQARAVAHVQEHGSITRVEYEALLHTSEWKAREDLSALVASGMLVRRGSRGPGTRYVLPNAPDENGKAK